MDKHDTLLICSGTPENRQHLRQTLEERYHLLEARDTNQAILLLRQNIGCIAAVLLDISQSASGELRQMADLADRNQLREIPVIVIAGQEKPEFLQEAFRTGAADVIPLMYDPDAMLHRVENIVELHLHKQYLKSMLHKQANELRQANETLVDALSSIIEHRSVESGQHILRIRHFTKSLLEEVVRSCPEYGLEESVIPLIASASALHDIGKIAIPDAILMKPGPLTEEEREVMKTHAATGCQILDSLRGVGETEYMRYAHNICHYHHERWDGGGYPEGLSGDEIPICAQVVGLADAYDALTSKRVYKEAYPFSQAVNMILKGACGVFSPKLLECFKNVTGIYEEFARAYADGFSPERQGFDKIPIPPVKQEENSLERVRAKYFALVHYINGLLIEVDMNNGLFHLIYNPYPEMAWLENAVTFEDMMRLLDERVLSANGLNQMKQFFWKVIPAFIDQDLRRSSHHFRFRSQAHPEGDAFEVTLLRINPIDTKHRTLAILCRREEEPVFRTQQNETASILSDSTYLCRNDEKYTFVQLGRQISMLAGYSKQELEERFDNQLLNLVLPEDRKHLRNSLQSQLTHSVNAEVEYRVRHKNGRILWVLNKSRLSIGADGKEYLNSFVTDISDTRQEIGTLRDKLARYEIILAQTENVLFEWNIEEDRLIVSETWEIIFGYTPTGLHGQQVLENGFFFHPDDLPLIYDCISNLESGSQYESVEARVATARGRYLWCRFRASAIRNDEGKLLKVVGIIINIDAEKQAERRLQERAERDSLTKLLNKNAAQRQAEDYLSRFSEGANCALLIIDLDNFKQVNDQYGHLFGDAVLSKAANEIKKLFRNQDIVARIGGDEFLVLMRGTAEQELIDYRCQRLLKNLCGLFSEQKFKLPLSCSIGIALSPQHGFSYYELFRNADRALYQAKSQGKSTYVFFDDTTNTFLQKAGQSYSPNTPIESDREPSLAEDNLVRYAFQRLYSSNDVDRAINDILAMVGQKMNVSRVYIFENSDDNRFCSNTYEWCNEHILPEIQNLQGISYERDIPGYTECYNEQGLLYCSDIRELPEEVYAIVAPQNIKSMLHCAIREGGVFRGYIGFDECVENRYWTKEQILALQYFSEMISVFLMKHREHKRSLRAAKEGRSILDNQNAWIYIIDPDTCQIKYLNTKSRELAPSAQPGMYCYKAIMGLDNRCPNCPGKEIRSKKTDSAQIENTYLGLPVLAEATLIQWEGEESCLVTCRRLSEDSLRQ